ncbi:MAG: hypothetical protein IPN26_00220 [Bacteroidetes bacterium]|nr:hypothetical protein [Bacteroidota bacterium]
MKYNYCGNNQTFNLAACDSIVLPDTTQQPFLNLIQTLQPVPQAGAYVLAHNIEVDSLYNIYVSGEFNHSCDFNPLGSPYYDSSFYPMYNMPDVLS